MCRGCLNRMTSCIGIIVIIIILALLFWKNPPWFSEIIQKLKGI